MKAGIYARISQDTEGQGLGVARQEQACRAKATALGWDVVDTYVDNDLSASKAVPRPQYDRLMADLAAGTINALVVYDLDRLTRKPAELETFIDLADKHSISLANVSGDVDLSNANGRMVARIKGAVARQESERISERVRAKQRQSAESGKKHQGFARVFGYTRSFEVIEGEAAVVRDVFARKAAGESLTSIAHRLNQENITTVRGGTWDASAISKMIKRHDYIGVITVKGEVIGAADFEPIVDKALWAKANEEAEKVNNRGRGARKSLLAGFLICDNCGTKMKQGGAKDAPRYNCPSHKAVVGACGSCSIVAPATDDAIIGLAFEKMQATGEPKTPAVVRDWRAEEQLIRDEMEKANSYRRSRELAMEDFVPLMAELREQLNTLLKEEASALDLPNLGAVGSFLDFQVMSISEKRTWLDQYISHVEVAKAERVGIKGFKPERLTVHFTDGEIRRLEPGLRYLITPPEGLSKVEDFESALNKHGWTIQTMDED